MKYLLASTWLVLAGVGGIAMAQTSLPGDARPLVHLADGDLVGVAHDRITQFLGIPYAAPPVGPLRWKAPAPVISWSGQRDASVPGPACPQAKLPPNTPYFVPPKQSEDCLYLNVWAPEHVPAGTALPVMVWIHGGGFVLGTGTEPYYDGSALAKRGIIVLTINYRLGYLGYFTTRSMSKEGAPGNFALMDQLAALHWVQRNVAAFGGDPKQVTLAGESAGGVSVLALMTNPGSQGLFHQAIVQSGLGWRAPLNQQQMIDSVRDGLQKVGVDTDADESLLREVPIEKLVEAQSLIKSAEFGPFLDGVTMARAPYEVFQAGGQLAIPLLIGSNTFEASLRHSLPAANDWTAKMASETVIKPLYEGKGSVGGSPQDRLYADVVMVAPARWVARSQSRIAHAYLYSFGYVPQAMRGRWPGAPHGTDLPYVFDNVAEFYKMIHVPPNEADFHLAATVADCWAAFVRHGQPKCSLDPWHAYSEMPDDVMYIGEEMDRSMRKKRSEALDTIDHHFAPGKSWHDVPY